MEIKDHIGDDDKDVAVPMPTCPSELDSLDVFFGITYEGYEQNGIGTLCCKHHVESYNLFILHDVARVWRNTKPIRIEMRVGDFKEQKANTKNRVQYLDQNAIALADRDRRLPKNLDKYCSVNRRERKDMIKRGYEAIGNRAFLTITFDQPEVLRPMTLTESGALVPLIPHDCRSTTGRTYSGPMTLRVNKKMERWRWDSENTRYIRETITLPYSGERIMVGLIPVQRRSILCHSTEPFPPYRVKSPSQLVAMKESPTDPGGDFPMNSKMSAVYPHETKDSFRIFVCIGKNGMVYGAFSSHMRDTNFDPDTIAVRKSLDPSTKHDVCKQTQLSRVRTRTMAGVTSADDIGGLPDESSMSIDTVLSLEEQERERREAEMLSGNLDEELDEGDEDEDDDEEMKGPEANPLHAAQASAAVKAAEQQQIPVVPISTERKDMEVIPEDSPLWTTPMSGDAVDKIIAKEAAELGALRPALSEHEQYASILDKVNDSTKNKFIARKFRQMRRATTEAAQARTTLKLQIYAGGQKTLVPLPTVFSALGVENVEDAIRHIAGDDLIDEVGMYQEEIRYTWVMHEGVTKKRQALYRIGRFCTKADAKLAVQDIVDQGTYFLQYGILRNYMGTKEPKSKEAFELKLLHISLIAREVLRFEAGLRPRGLSTVGADGKVSITLDLPADAGENARSQFDERALVIDRKSLHMTLRSAVHNYCKHITSQCRLNLSTVISEPIFGIAESCHILTRDMRSFRSTRDQVRNTESNSGIRQNVFSYNQQLFFSQLRRIHNKVNVHSKSEGRRRDPTLFRGACPRESPIGRNNGYTKNMSILSTISTGTSIKSANWLTNKWSARLEPVNSILRPVGTFVSSATMAAAARDEAKQQRRTKIFVDGNWIGNTPDPAKEFAWVWKVKIDAAALVVKASSAAPGSPASESVKQMITTIIVEGGDLMMMGIHWNRDGYEMNVRLHLGRIMVPVWRVDPETQQLLVPKSVLEEDWLPRKKLQSEHKTILTWAKKTAVKTHANPRRHCPEYFLLDGDEQVYIKRCIKVYKSCLALGCVVWVDCADQHDRNVKQCASPYQLPAYGLRREIGDEKKRATAPVKYQFIPIHPGDMDGIVASQLVYSNHNVAQRATSAASMRKQALEIPSYSYEASTSDTIENVLVHPQRRIIQTPMTLATACDKLSVATNAIQALMGTDMTSQEDGTSVSLFGVELGLFATHSTAILDIVSYPNKQTALNKLKQHVLSQSVPNMSSQLYNKTTSPPVLVMPNQALVSVPVHQWSLTLPPPAVKKESKTKTKKSESQSSPLVLDLSVKSKPKPVSRSSKGGGKAKKVKVKIEPKGDGDEETKSSPAAAAAMGASGPVRGGDDEGPKLQDMVYQMPALLFSLDAEDYLKEHALASITWREGGAHPHSGRVRSRRDDGLEEKEEDEKKDKEETKGKMDMDDLPIPSSSAFGFGVSALASNPILMLPISEYTPLPQLMKKSSIRTSKKKLADAVAAGDNHHLLTRRTLRASLSDFTKPLANVSYLREEAPKTFSLERYQKCKPKVQELMRKDRHIDPKTNLVRVGSALRDGDTLCRKAQVSMDDVVEELGGGLSVAAYTQSGGAGGDDDDEDDWVDADDEIEIPPLEDRDGKSADGHLARATASGKPLRKKRKHPQYEREYINTPMRTYVSQIKETPDYLGRLHIKMKLRYRHEPELGDKEGNGNGQKGVKASKTQKGHSVWCEVDGMPVDMERNVASVPSRRTVGELLEPLCNMIACRHPNVDLQTTGTSIRYRSIFANEFTRNSEFDRYCDSITRELLTIFNSPELSWLAYVEIDQHVAAILKSWSNKAARDKPVMMTKLAKYLKMTLAKTSRLWSTIGLPDSRAREEIPVAHVEEDGLPLAAPASAPIKRSKHSWTRKTNFQRVVDSRKKRKANRKKTKLRITGVHERDVNRLRMTMLLDVPTMAVHRVVVHETPNTGLQYHDMLETYIQNIPIRADAREFKYLDAKTDGSRNIVIDETNSIKFELHVRHPANAETNLKVTSADMKLTDYSIRAHPHIRPVSSRIHITTLAPGESVHATIICCKGTGRRHAKWSPVCQLGHRLEPVVEFTKTAQQEPILDDEARLLVTACPQKVFDIEELSQGVASVKIARPELCNPNCQQCRNPLLPFGKKIRIDRSPRTFILPVESIGQYDHVKDVIDIALDMCRQDLEIGL